MYCAEGTSASFTRCTFGLAQTSYTKRILLVSMGTKKKKTKCVFVKPLPASSIFLDRRLMGALLYRTCNLVRCGVSGKVQRGIVFAIFEVGMTHAEAATVVAADCHAYHRSENFQIRVCRGTARRPQRTQIEETSNIAVGLQFRISVQWITQGKRARSCCVQKSL